MSEEEDLVIKFENQSGVEYDIRYCNYDDKWDISEHTETSLLHVASFRLLYDAEACAEILKRSV